MQHLEKIIFGVVLACAVLLVAAHGTSGVNVTKADFDAGTLETNMQLAKVPASAATKVPAAEDALRPFIHTVESPPRAGRWSFYRRPTLKGIEKKKPDLRKILEAPALTVVRADFTATLTWTDSAGSSATVTAYRVYRWVGDAKPDKTPVAELKPEVHEWTDNDAKVLQPDAAVHYAVTAMTAADTRHGKPESPQSEPVTVTFPYNRELLYYGSSYKGSKGKVATVLVKLGHTGKWRGPRSFDVTVGGVIGGKAKVDVDGEQVELDFTTKWTLQDAVKKSSVQEVDGVDKAVTEIYLEVTDAAGAVLKVMKSDKPKSAGPKKPKDPVSKIAFELYAKMQAARASKDFDERDRLSKLRGWVNRGKRKWWSSSRRQKITKTIEKDLWNLDIDLEEAQEEGAKPSKIKELQAKIDILKRIAAE